MTRIRIAALAAAVSLVACAAEAQTACPVSTGACGFTATTTPSAITFNASKRYQRICDSSASVDIWATRVPGATAAVNGVGSFKIAAGTCEEYPIANSSYVPPYPTSVVSASSAPGSVEIN